MAHINDNFGLNKQFTINFFGITNESYYWRSITEKRLKQRMWWPGMSVDIKHYVQTCQIGNDGFQHRLG